MSCVPAGQGALLHLLLNVDLVGHRDDGSFGGQGLGGRGQRVKDEPTSHPVSLMSALVWVATRPGWEREWRRERQRERGGPE